MPHLKGLKLFDLFNYTLMSILGMLTIFPFLQVVSQSFSSESALISNKVTFYPIGFHLETFKYIMSDSLFISAFRNSLIITISGTILGLLITVITAYPLSKPHLKGRKMLLITFIFGWLFQPGIIPNYLLIKQLGLINNLASLILPSMLLIFNMLLMKNFFESVPDGLEEAAKMDGASNFRTLFSIVLPISLPVLATIGLFYAVFYWNSYFYARIYISSSGLKPLQLYLYELVTQSMMMTQNINQTNAAEMVNVTPNGIRAAAVVLSTLPIALVYPFLQKYFVKGLVIGAIKG